MDVREKLVELIGSTEYGNGSLVGKNFQKGFIGKIASNLIANGVTAQEWISVKDMLPEIPEGWAESPEPVLYMMKNTKTIYAGYYGEGGVWRDKYFRQYSDSRNGVDADDVLCWMYQHDLPQPPKGE